MKKELKKAMIKAVRSMYKSLPVLFGILLLISLANVIIPKTVYSSVFGGNPFFDPFIGSFFGSILAGNPITSYIIGGELLEQGISLLAVTSFLVAWVTVGFVQLPAESVILGKRFAIVRNITSFLLAIVVAAITVSIWGLL